MSAEQLEVGSYIPDTVEEFLKLTAPEGDDIHVHLSVLDKKGNELARDNIVLRAAPAGTTTTTTHDLLVIRKGKTTSFRVVGENFRAYSYDYYWGRNKVRPGDTIHFVLTVEWVS